MHAGGAAPVQAVWGGGREPGTGGHIEPFFSKMLEPEAAEGKGRGVKSLHVVVVFHGDSQCASSMVGLTLETKVGLPAFLVCSHA